MIKVGISSCLLGQNVRFDGGHKHSSLCTELLFDHFHYTPICPEVGIGLGVPRKPIRLIGTVEAPQAVTSHDATLNYTQALRDYGHAQAQQHRDLSGYIFMKNSPSCGLFRVKVYGENGYPVPKGGRGIYADALTRYYPLLPVEESGRLCDATLRENFITRVYAYHNWQQLVTEGLSHRNILAFHVRYKYCLMAHSPSQYQVLGRMLADAGKHDPATLGQQYFSALMMTLSQLASRKTHSNVLMHLQGYLKHVLSSQEKQALAQLIEQYRTALIPLIVPITMLKHHFANHPNDYIAQQAYLQPYPDDLKLRNQI